MNISKYLLLVAAAVLLAVGLSPGPAQAWENEQIYQNGQGQTWYRYGMGHADRDNLVNRKHVTTIDDQGRQRSRYTKKKFNPATGRWKTKRTKTTAKNKQWKAETRGWYANDTTVRKQSRITRPTGEVVSRNTRKAVDPDGQWTRKKSVVNMPDGSKGQRTVRTRTNPFSGNEHRRVAVNKPNGESRSLHVKSSQVPNTNVTRKKVILTNPAGESKSRTLRIKK